MGQRSEGLPTRTIVRVSMSRIFSNPRKARGPISEESVRGLAESIRRCGLLSPLLLRRIDAGRYEIIAGERRFQALRLLGTSHAEAVILSAYDGDCALVSLVENLQREQLHYLEEAAAFRSLLEEHGFTQETLARLTGRSPSAMANRLRLLKLPEPVLAMLPSSGLTERHARALLKAEPDEALAAARTAAREHMSVRQLEEYIARGRARRIARPMPGLRDNRLVVNALLDTVKELKRLGVRAMARVEEQDGGVDVIVSIRTGEPVRGANGGSGVAEKKKPATPSVAG